jgi:hypothetical protein
MKRFTKAVQSIDDVTRFPLVMHESINVESHPLLGLLLQRVVKTIMHGGSWQNHPRYTVSAAQLDPLVATLHEVSPHSTSSIRNEQHSELKERRGQ